MRLKDKVAIVTGSAQGMGKAIAICLAREGARLVINDVNQSLLQNTAPEIEKISAPVIAIQADISDKRQVDEMIRKTVETFGRIDILVNNAGGALHTHNRIEEITIDDWEKVININLRGAFLCSQAVIAQMRKQGTGGKIINMSAMAGRSYATLAGVQYTCAKAGVGGLTRQLAREVGPDGINVNAVAPTVVMTGERVRRLWEAKSEQARKRTIESIPLRRLAEPEEIGRVVAFLASDDASYVTGITLDVNGGRFMS